MGNARNLRNLGRLSRDLKRITSEGILRWAFDTYSGKVALSSSFGAQSAVLLHMATRIQPDIPVVFLDTGFHFSETYEFVDTMTKRLSLNLRVFRPTDDELAQARERLAAGRPGQCCDLAKVSCMNRALQGLECWIAGLRRRQAITRRRVRLIEQTRDGVVKIHPIAYWGHRDVEAYLAAFDLPRHPLWERGYTSIGCEPCTRRPLLGQGLRSGRWAGLAKSECGIHTAFKAD
jgi:phosphoadenosine phosphosulfate reductase